MSDKSRLRRYGLERHIGHLRMVPDSDGCWTQADPAEAALAERDKRIAELEGRIQEAMQIASGRWEEWGSRAVRVANVLDGGDREVDD